MVGMNNSHGGVIIFGVDNNRYIVGLNQPSNIPDNAQISQFCTSHFSEMIRFERREITTKDKVIVAFYIYPRATELLAVCTKDSEDIYDGDIYVRLSGATEKIKGNALSRYLHKIYQKDDSDITNLQKKALIAQHAPKLRSGHCCRSTEQEIELYIRNEGPDATLTNLTCPSEDIGIDFSKPILIAYGANVYLPLYNKTNKIATNLRFDILIEYKDQLDNLYEQKINCNGASMTFLHPELTMNN